ncbi:MAG TPA: dihydroorotate dehydrogenase electron transfer subunit [Thermoleophilia bacterium]|nr:dihydroorotate dehydrogenase electron transfer subunit [Thermoleophilia bacterium]
MDAAPDRSVTQGADTGCATATSGEFSVIERRAFGRYVLLTLLAPPLAAVAQPGQFVMAAVPGDGFRLRRPLSLHSADGERVRLLVEPRGAGSRALASAGVADRLALAGPLGNGFPLDGLASALIVGGGIGTAPFQFVHDALRARGVPVTAVFGFRDAEQARLAGAFEIDDLYLATDDGAVGRRASAVDLAREVGAGPRASVLACGPAPMLAAVRAWAREAGLDGYASLEAHMACGTGACHGCVVPTADGYLRVCVDGPVFSFETLAVEAT